jgi:sulfur carrier protein
MKVTVNGEEKEIKEGTKIGELLKELGIEKKTMATAVNMEVVKKEDWDTHVIQEGDKIEFLHFVGGG